MVGELHVHVPTRTNTGQVAAGDDLPVPIALRPGATLGRFRIEELLGEGGMGFVLRARDADLDRRVAIKVVRGEGTSAVARHRLLREAQAMARLAHPHVVVVHEVGEVDGSIYLVMEHVAGQTLSAWLADGPRSPRQILDAFAEAGRGLGAAHRAGLVHRDFKPDNVLVGADGRVRVGDFGIARVLPDPEAPAAAASAPARATVTGATVGTPDYMAPEQWQGAAGDARTDQFGFAIALYEALYQRHPFGDDRDARRARVTGGRFDPPPRRRGVPDAVRSALATALAPDPADRHASFEPLLAALSPRRARRTLILGAAFGVVAVGGSVASWAARDREAPGCRDATPLLAGTWDDAARFRVRAAFAATGVHDHVAEADATVRALEDYAAGWTTGRQRACETTRVRNEQAPITLERRVGCYDRRLGELRAVVQVLARADAEVAARGLDVVHSLGELAACDDLDALAAAVPPSPVIAARVAEVRQQLALTNAEWIAGHATIADEQSRLAAAAAETTRDWPVIAEARLLRGRIEGELGQHAAARRTLASAADAAARAHDDTRLARALVETVRMVGGELRRTDEALVLADAARAAAVRAGDDRVLLLEELYRGDTLATAGRVREALPYLTRAVATAERRAAGGGRDARRDLAQALNLLASAHLARDDYGPALPLLERTVAIDVATLGQRHPDVGASRHNLGVNLMGAGRHDEARRQLLLARSIFEDALGARHYKVGLVELVLGQLATAEGHPEQARAHFERGRDLLAAGTSPRHFMAQAEHGLGVAWRDRGDCARAIPRFAEAVRIYDQVGVTGDTLAVSLVGQGMCLVDTGAHLAAVAVLERALGPDRGDDGHPAIELEARRGLAEARWQLGQRARAIAQLEAAHRAAAGATDPEVLHYNATEVAGWLRAHRGRVR